MFRLIAWDDSVPVVLRVTQISHKRLLSIAVPIVLSNVTVPILGAVDTGVIGQLGDAAAIGAVGIGAVVIGAIYWLFGFLRMGTTGLAAQAFGAGDQSELSALLLRSVIIAGMGGAILIAAQGAIFNAAFFMSPASPAVETLARQYMEIRIYSAPAAIAIYGATGWLIAQERTRAVFSIQTIDPLEPLVGEVKLMQCRVFYDDLVQIGNELLHPTMCIEVQQFPGGTVIMIPFSPLC